MNIPFQGFPNLINSTISGAPINYVTTPPPPLPYYMYPPPSYYPYGYYPYPGAFYPNFNHVTNAPNYIQPKAKYHCQNCDKDYFTEHKYKEHVGQHVKCPSEGCDFSACESLIEFHFQWQHVTGLAKKCWGQTPEEISEWIRDRKKNYPTIIKQQQKEKKQKHTIQKRPQLRYSNTHSNYSSKIKHEYSNTDSKFGNFSKTFCKPTNSDNNNCNNMENVDERTLKEVDGFNRVKMYTGHRKRSLNYISKAAHNKMPLGSDITKWRKKYTLLERLLAPQIKDERQTLLKCIKLIDKYIIPDFNINPIKQP